MHQLVAGAATHIQKYRLKGTGIVLSKMLPAQEQREHIALCTQFRQALTRGCKAQFKHGRLLVFFSPSGPCAFLFFLHLAVVEVGMSGRTLSDPLG
eukprot:37897-Chlamydomonas_euryale.AAC.27